MLEDMLMQALQDCYGDEFFQFSLCCPECGMRWKSRALRFSKAGIKPGTEGKSIVFDALYEREKAAAFRQAVKEAGQCFSICPICGRLVCDRCFRLCEDLDMCVSCAEKLNEHGESVV